jgi:hypothetical protein
MENVLLVGEPVVEDVDERSSGGVGEGNDVRILLARRMSDVEALLSRRVAADGMATYSRLAIRRKRLV